MHEWMDMASCLDQSIDQRPAAASIDRSSLGGRGQRPLLCCASHPIESNASSSSPSPHNTHPALSQEARKYHSSSRIVEVQSEITARSLELLALEVCICICVWRDGCCAGATVPDGRLAVDSHRFRSTHQPIDPSIHRRHPSQTQPGERALILDIGCGSGLSGEAIEEAGHVWVGCDISRDMLAVAAERESE